MRTYTYLIVFAIVLSMVSCHSGKKTKSQNIKATGDNSMITLDWDGIYQGILPCADCEGIKTQLILHKDLTYTLQTQYVGRKDTVFTEKGKFNWVENGGSIILDNACKQKYLVGENRIFHLDKDGKRISGDLADKYVLKKEAPVLEGKYWKLVRLNGKDVENQRKEPHIKFDADNKRASGNGGCNQFSCSFENPGPKRLTFGNVMSTKMACIGGSVEDEFFKVLQQTTIYSLTADELKLKNEFETTLAIFKSDFFK